MNNLVRREASKNGSVPQHSYALGYSESEFRRLELQSQFIRELTEDLLRRAGINLGMRVLDIGCGVGDVSLLLGELVGPAGAVLGVDRSEDAVAVSGRRAAAAGFGHLRFESAELDAFSTQDKFDAIVGRLILAYVPDPAALLRSLRAYLRPGGVIVFHEALVTDFRSIPEGPQFHQCRRWILDTFEHAGFDLDMGGKLFATFVEAGLPEPRMIGASRLEAGAQSPAYGWMAETLRSLLPMAARHGVTTAAEADIETMAERLRRESIASNASIVLPLVGAWARV
jgi:ubiquinone/menaquinone biosynthesis C-methylase UbiE